MDIDKLSGIWRGSIEGTNAGDVEVDIAVTPAGLVAQLALRENGGPTVFLLGAGKANADSVVFELGARDPSQAGQFGVVTVHLGFDNDGVLTGAWQTTVGTSGTFRATRPVSQEAAEPRAAAVSTARAHEKYTRAPSCVVDLDTLQRLYDALRIGGEEAARLHHGAHTGTARSSEETLRLYRVTVSVRGAQGELMITEDPGVLASSALPKPLKSIEFQIGLAYQIYANAQAPNRAHLTLDFSRPHAFDLSSPSGEPTPNDSKISVYGTDLIWVAGVYERLRSVLQQNAVRTGWLHRSHTYDVLVFTIGFPFSLSLAVLAASNAPPPPGASPAVFAVAVFFFVGVAAVSLFRLAFSATRWMLPYIEFSAAPEPLYRKLRLIGSTIVFGVIASLAAAAIWQILVS